MNGAAAAGQPRQQQATGNHLGKQGPSHRNSLNHQVSTFNFLDFSSGLVVFQRDGIIGEARIQSQAALQWIFVLWQAPDENICICESPAAAYDVHA
jgi:hypothetical protein